MRQRNSYSRIVQDPVEWKAISKGAKIQLFQHCIEKDITSFMINTASGSYDKSLGTAFSESGLSRDEIQFVAALGDSNEEERIVEKVENIIDLLDIDYLDLLLLDFKLPPEMLFQLLKT